MPVMVINMARVKMETLEAMAMPKNMPVSMKFLYFPSIWAQERKYSVTVTKNAAKLSTTKKCDC